MIHEAKLNVNLWVSYKKVVELSFVTIKIKATKIYMHTYGEKALRYPWECKFEVQQTMETYNEAISEQSNNF